MIRVSATDCFSAVCSIAIRGTILAAVALGTASCANEPLNSGTPRFASPMMLLNSPAAAAEALAPSGERSSDLSHKSLAAKVLASRALESVTGLKTDPARLSEHD